MSKFILNEIFEQNAKVYQVKPVRATKYQKGMETGFVVYFTNKPNKEGDIHSHEGMKFFYTETEAWDYINSNPKQYIKKSNELVEVDVVYDPPLPVLHRKIDNPDERVGYIGCHEGQFAFVSNETEQYDFYFLDGYTTDKPTWIIQDSDGNVRVWDIDLLDCGESFFGNPENFVYEKVAEDKYVKVAV